MKKILGTEPALVVSLLTGLIAFLVTIPEVGLTHDMAATITAVVVAAGALLEGWTAVQTRTALVVGLLKTLLALVVGFGLPISEQTQGALTALVVTALGLFQRQTTNSATTAVSLSDVDAGLEPAVPAPLVLTGPVVLNGDGTGRMGGLGPSVADPHADDVEQDGPMLEEEPLPASPTRRPRTGDVPAAENEQRVVPYVETAGQDGDVDEDDGEGGAHRA